MNTNAYQLLASGYKIPVAANTTTSGTITIPTGRGNVKRFGLLATPVGVDFSTLNDIQITVAFNGVNVIENMTGLMFALQNFSQNPLFELILQDANGKWTEGFEEGSTITYTIVNAGATLPTVHIIPYYTENE